MRHHDLQQGHGRRGVSRGRPCVESGPAHRLGQQAEQGQTADARQADPQKEAQAQTQQRESAPLGRGEGEAHPEEHGLAHELDGQGREAVASGQGGQGNPATSARGRPGAG